VNCGVCVCVGLDSLLVLTEVPSDKVTSYEYICYIHTILC